MGHDDKKCHCCCCCQCKDCDCDCHKNDEECRDEEEKDNEKKGDFKNCLSVFITIEKSDQEEMLNKVSKDIVEIALKNNRKTSTATIAPGIHSFMSKFSFNHL